MSGRNLCSPPASIRQRAPAANPYHPRRVPRRRGVGPIVRHCGKRAKPLPADAGVMTDIIEITEDNYGQLGLDAETVGQTAVCHRGTVTVHAEWHQAMDAIQTLGSVQIGEGLMVGSGRRWTVVDDEDEFVDDEPSPGFRAED